MATKQPTPARRNIKRRSYAAEANPNYRGGFASSCPQCQARVWVKPSRAADPNHFCSKACCHAWMRDNTTALDHWRYQGGDVERTCEACAERFHQRRAEYNRNPARYCSRKCSGIGRRKRQALACEVCKTLFEPKAYKKDARFCSRPCKHASQKKQRTPEEVVRARVHKRMTALMWQALKHKKAGRSWVSIVGYDATALVKHLESQFTAGMSWANFGDWHIDHIKPCSAFLFTSTDDAAFQECWSLANLRPLWEFDNLSKGARWSPEDVEEIRAAMPQTV